MSEQTASPAVTEPGGAPRFKRVLSRGDLILYGLVILTPTAPYPVYGIVQQVSQGHVALSYLVAMAAMLYTAASYGKMSGAFPSAAESCQVPRLCVYLRQLHMAIAYRSTHDALDAHTFVSQAVSIKLFGHVPLVSIQLVFAHVRDEAQ